MKASAKTPGFDGPTRLPRDQDERRRWQSANRAWWERTPMRYDWRKQLIPTTGSAAYFEEIDRRFLSAARSFMPLPFDALIPFDALAERDVLEIGIGQGTHAQLLSPRCKSYTGIDLTAAATEMTARRFHLFCLPGAVFRMDAEALAFRDESFDYVWSWGVVHHTADTARALAEIRRVLRPGGECTLMVYYRSWWSYYLFGLLRWLFLRRGGSTNSLHTAIQRGTDGTIARFYTPTDWRTLAGGLFAIDDFAVYGQKSDVVPLPASRLKDRLMAMLPDPLARVLTHTMRMGSFLVIQMRKPA
jgi:SAM-dependent methyltransferase